MPRHCNRRVGRGKGTETRWNIRFLDLAMFRRKSTVLALLCYSFHIFDQERRALLAELLWGPGPPLLEIMRLRRSRRRRNGRMLLHFEPETVRKTQQKMTREPVEHRFHREARPLWQLHRAAGDSFELWTRRGACAGRAP